MSSAALLLGRWKRSDCEDFEVRVAVGLRRRFDAGLFGDWGRDEAAAIEAHLRSKEGNSVVDDRRSSFRLAAS